MHASDSPRFAAWVGSRCMTVSKCFEGILSGRHHGVAEEEPSTVDQKSTAAAADAVADEDDDDDELAEEEMRSMSDLDWRILPAEAGRGVLVGVEDCQCLAVCCSRCLADACCWRADMRAASKGHCWGTSKRAISSRMRSLRSLGLPVNSPNVACTNCS